MGKNLLGWIFLLFFLPAVTSAGPAVPAAIGVKAPEFSLRDQHNRIFDLQRAEGRPMVLVASDGEGSKYNRKWVDAIKERYRGRIEIIGIADTRGVPFFLKGYVKGKFRKSPDPILLDWDGAVFTSYELAPKETNIVLIDKNGIVRYRTVGEATTKAQEALFRQIDRLE